MLRYITLLILLNMAPAVLAANHCVILQYHHFSDKTPPSTSIKETQFVDQLNYLAENEFTVMSLRDVALSLYHQLELPDKCVSLSVDDAYLSVYKTAYPLVKQHHWPLTVFVSSDNVAENSSLYMSWQELREMAQNGISIENHGKSHSHMVRLNPGESEKQWLMRIRSDILQSQQQITRQIGVAPQLFAWPYGEYNSKLGKLIRDMDLIGFGQQSGPAWADANFSALPRFPMADRFANLDGFITKVNTLPLPLVRAKPVEPIVESGNSRPTLTLTLAPRRYSKTNLRCYIGGSDQVAMNWSDEKEDTVEVTPLFDLKPGRHRTNCTMPSSQKGRFHWYSHNWIVPNADGSWYHES
jgi:poly-beta-1,6-N-acetyl-D-glucosamine N-deacetylase